MNNHEDGKEDIKICHWCDRPIHGRFWRDGRRYYCSSECHSAGLFSLFLPITVLFSTLLILFLIWPVGMFYFFTRTNSYNFSPNFTSSPLFLAIIFSVIALLFCCSIGFAKWTYQGWNHRRARNGVEKTDIRN